MISTPRPQRVRLASVAAAFILSCAASASAQACLERPPDSASDGALLQYAAAAAGQRVKPSRIDALWAIEPPVRELAAELAAARQTGAVAGWLAALEPQHLHYRRLAAECDRYRRIAEAGGWTALPPGGVLREDDADASVEALRSRLVAEGYPAGEAGQPFDAALASALRDFQQRHDLEPDGVLGPATRAALDVSVAQRLGQIAASLERWRWAPPVLPPERIEVNIAGAEATLFRADQPALAMRTIVGDGKHMTPMFASAIDTVVFNPPWNVPDSILRNEIQPKIRRDPGYLRRMNMVWTSNGLQQRPGGNNALGLLKFDLPSPFGVYLHDTSSRGLFARSMRTLSHGCIRLEKPRPLAAELLAAQGWVAGDVDRAIAAGATRRVALKSKLPLLVLYLTVTAGEDGWARFHRDPYGWDAKLMAALTRN